MALALFDHELIEYPMSKQNGILTVLPHQHLLHLGVTLLAFLFGHILNNRVDACPEGRLDECGNPPSLLLSRVLDELIGHFSDS
jgi:hypothetical protein